MDVCHVQIFLKPSRRMSRQPREDAYGPSPIASSTRGTKQIDLWMDVVRIEAMQFFPG
jgi:hypothetical protein